MKDTIEIQQLNKTELSVINGGNILVGILISAIIDAIDNPDDFNSGMFAGAEAVISTQK